MAPAALSIIHCYFERWNGTALLQVAIVHNQPWASIFFGNDITIPTPLKELKLQLRKNISWWKKLVKNIKKYCMKKNKVLHTFINSFHKGIKQDYSLVVPLTGIADSGGEDAATMINS